MFDNAVTVSIWGGIPFVAGGELRGLGCLGMHRECYKFTPSVPKQLSF